jgi:glucokinase
MAKSGDKAAAQVLNESAEIIGAGLAGLAQILNPDIIVIGGGVAKDPWLWKPAISAFKRYVTLPDLRTTPIVLAKLGGDANLIGAAALLQGFGEDMDIS